MFTGIVQAVGRLETLHPLASPPAACRSPT